MKFFSLLKLKGEGSLR